MLEWKNASDDQVDSLVQRALNKLCKWRTVFVGWQLGTRPKGDPESDAVRDTRELLILLRVEVTAITKLLLDKRVCTHREFQIALLDEAQKLDADYERRFPGFKATDDGMQINISMARETMRGWKP